MLQLRVESLGFDFSFLISLIRLGSGRFGVGFWVGFWVGLRARDFPTERVPGKNFFF